jgi:dehydrogenase/reductase SDR family protein 4
MDSFDLSGKVAIVTGASKGIGEAIARKLAEQGARVVVSSRKQHAVDEVAKAFLADGLEATAIACNVGKQPELEHLVSQTVERYGGVDILINNAAANPVFGPLLNTEPWAFDKIMDVNVKGPYLLGNLLQPIMRERGGGTVVNISSIGGLSPEPGLGIYSVSKASLISLTKVQAKEWGQVGIRVNAICPGLIKTKFSQALWSNEGILKSVLKQQALPKLGEPQDIATLALFLASEASAFCTGMVFTADGGMTI